MKQVESYTNADMYLILIQLTPTIVFVQWWCCSVETKILIEDVSIERKLYLPQ